MNTFVAHYVDYVLTTLKVKLIVGEVPECVVELKWVWNEAFSCLSYVKLIVVSFMTDLLETVSFSHFTSE